MSEENLYEVANEFIFEKMLKFFNIPQDQIEQYQESFKQSDEVKMELTKLYTQPKTVLIVGNNQKSGKGEFVMNPKDHKKKGVLVLKTNKEDELDPDMSKNFTFIELTKKILDEMYDICKDIFFPMLNQSVQNENQSDLISKELVEKFHNFLSHFYVCLGHMKGQTKLPEPSDEIFRNPKINENEKTQICEGAVVMWIDLIRYILKQEPEHEFRDGNNPLPITEIEFWKRRQETLNDILNQIKKKSIKEKLEFLQKQKSTYFTMFNEIKKDVEAKAKEATYNYTYLQVLEKSFNLLTDTNKELLELCDEFEPMFHIIRLIWEENEYYRKPERLIVLIRKICNAIIEKGTEEVNQKILTKILDEPDKEILKLEEVREDIAVFMNSFYAYRGGKKEDKEENKEENPEENKEENKEENPEENKEENNENGEENEEKKEEENEGKKEWDEWKITRNVIFYRLDAFNDRLGDILNVAKSFFEFRKMSEKVLGGIKADALQDALKKIFDECTNAVKTFNTPTVEGESGFNALDISSDLFNVRYSEFKDALKELERKISAVLTQSFDENETIIGKFKVLENFDSILERPYIAVELEKKYNILLEAFKNELKIVQNLFLTGKTLIDNNDPKSPLNKNMPPIAAKLNWTYSLKSRISEPLEKFNKCGKRITEKEEFKEIYSSYESLSKMIDDYGSQSKIQWDEKAKVASVEKQKIFILTKSEGLINVNFDPELNQLLKEVKYLNILNMEIPDEARETFEKNTIFRKQISDLENIKSQYNSIIKQLNEVEKPMVAKKLQKIEGILQEGFDKLTWEMNDKINVYTKKALDSISELSATVDKLKLFVSKVSNIFIEYNKPESMLFTRPDKLQEAIAVKTKFEALR